MESVIRTLNDEGFSGPTLISSFNPASIARARELDDRVATGLLTTDGVDAASALAFVRDQGHGFVLPHVEPVLAAGEAFVADAHAAGIRVGTWTVDDPATVRRLLQWGVDAVATNDPAMAASVRADLTGAGRR